MGAIFRKKGDTPEYTITPNPTYTDLYDNNQTTANIQSGTVDDITKTTIFLADYKLPLTPSYGNASLIGAETAFYINSITQGDGTHSVNLKTYSMKKEIGNREGGKASGTGTLISNEDIVQISAYHSDNIATITEDFSGAGRTGFSSGTSNMFTEGHQSYLNRTDGYDQGLRFGGGNLTGYNKMNKTDHLLTLGEDSSGPLGQHYKIRRDNSTGNSAWLNLLWWSDKKRKTLTGHYSEKYDPLRMSDKVKTTSGGQEVIFDSQRRREGSAGTSSTGGTTIQDVNFLSTYNSTFDIVDQDRSHAAIGADGVSYLAAYARSVLSDAVSRTGGNSLLMEAKYPHRDSTTTNIFYGQRNSADGSENQQSTFVSKVIPLPVHLYTREPTAAGDGKQPVTPTIELDINITELAPMLIRDQASYGLTGHDYRLSRSITVTFGEERPTPVHNLASYMLLHAPNSGSAGTGTGTGLGTSGKSFYGVSFVSYNGKIGFYNLGNAGKSGSTFTDSTWRYDATRAEICFDSAPTLPSLGTISGDFSTLAFQTHPNDQGAYWTMYDPTNGDIVIRNDPYTTGKLLNLKNISTSGSGVWADNLNYWPKYMTIWVNNRPAVKGKYNTTLKLYETGCVTTNGDGSAAGTDLHVVEGTGHKVDWIDAVITGAGADNAAYLALDAGTGITIADSNGGNPSDTTVSENSNTQDGTTSAGQLAVVSDVWNTGQHVFHRMNEDSQIDGVEDCNISMYVDQVRFKNYNMSHENATPSNGITNRINRLTIPATERLPNTAWQDGSSTVTNVFTNKTQQPSYMLLGFKNLTDITTEVFISEIKHLLMNGFINANPSISGNIITNADSDVSNIRVGFTSSVENLGRQSAADSTAGSPPDTGNGESPVFSNAEGTPSYAFRGLEVGDLDSTGKEFSVESDGSGDDGAGNVDYFTQKGLIKFKVGHDGLRKVDAGVNIATSDGNPFAQAATALKHSGADVFTVGGFIMVEDEIMQIEAINTGSNTLTVIRDVGATDDLAHPDGADIFHIAIPERRECIFASARAVNIPNGLKGKTSIIVDSPQLFNLREDEEYVIYEYNSAHSDEAINGQLDLALGDSYSFKVTAIEGNMITFDRPHGLSNSTAYKYLISPRRYWLMIEILNVAGAHGWQDDSVSTVYLPEKSYDNCVQISEKGTYGATFNESLYNDGSYVNQWSLEIYEPTDNSTIVKHEDYGLGMFDLKVLDGGFCGMLPLTINDTSKYVYTNLNNIVEVDSLKTGDVVPLYLVTNDPNDNVKVNIDTEIGTNKPYLIAKYEDSVPIVSSFKMSPNEINPYNVDFDWESPDEDLWYGFIMVSPDEVHSQYSGGVLHYPMNEIGDDGAKVPTGSPPVDHIQGMSTAIDSSGTTGPFYDIEGLAGNCLRNDATGTPAIEIGTGSADPLATTGYAVTDEFSINFHIIPDSEPDGTLADNHDLIISNEKIDLTIMTDRTLRLKLYWDANSAVQLRSSAKIVCDGETPTNIIITLDSNLTSGNVKMFINGQLEDISGEVITSDATGTTQNGWLFKSNLNTNNNKIFIGNTSASGSDEFLGRMEELVFYNRCLYPVNPYSGKMVFTKPLKELNDTSSSTPSNSYSVKLFIKDYHNIRGSTANEVACSSTLTIKKAAFRLDNS